jgi:hypothetical protein
LNDSAIKGGFARDSVEKVVGATPDFLCSLVTSAHFMRLSLKKAAYAVASSAAYRKSGTPHRFRPRYAGANLGHPSYSFRPCYDTDSYGTQSGESGYYATQFFHSPGRDLRPKTQNFDHASQSWHPAKANFGNLSRAQTQHEQHQRSAGVARE